MIESFLYNPDGQEFQAHSASLCEHRDELYCTWYVYTDKEHINGKVVIAKYNKSRLTWLSSKVVTNFPGSFGNPVLFSNGQSLILYYVKINNYWDDAQVYAMECLDTEKNIWDEPKKVNTPEGIMIRHKPIMSVNRFLIPAYDEKKMTSLIYEIKSNFTDWREVSKIEGHFIQGDLVNNSNNEIQIFMRAAKDNQNIFRALTTNSADSWHPPIKTPLPCPLSGIAAIKTGKQEVLLCYNHTLQHKRSPISLNLSHNLGTNFYEKAYDIESTDTELSYPNMLIDKDQNIHIVYTYARKKIKHVLTTHDEVLNLLEDINAK